MPDVSENLSPFATIFSRLQERMDAPQGKDHFHQASYLLNGIQENWKPIMRGIDIITYAAQKDPMLVHPHLRTINPADIQHLLQNHIQQSLIVREQGTPRYQHDSARLFLSVIGPTAYAGLKHEELADAVELYQTMRSLLNDTAEGCWYGAPELIGRSDLEADGWGLPLIYTIDYPFTGSKFITNVGKAGFVPRDPSKEALLEAIVAF